MAKRDVKVAWFTIRICAEGEHDWDMKYDLPRYIKKVCKKCGLIEEITCEEADKDVH